MDIGIDMCLDMYIGMFIDIGIDRANTKPATKRHRVHACRRDICRD